MESSKCDLTIVDANNYLYMIALAIRQQMIFMQMEDHPFKDLVNTRSPLGFVEQLYEAEGINLFVLPSGNPVGAIGFSKVPLWWAKDGAHILVEEFVISLDDSYVGFGRIAVRRLEELARLHDCFAIMSGNLLGVVPKQIENLYMKKANFNFHYKNFIKVL
jgi:hypothetical protein